MNLDQPCQTTPPIANGEVGNFDAGMGYEVFCDNGYKLTPTDGLTVGEDPAKGNVDCTVLADPVVACGE